MTRLVSVRADGVITNVTVGDYSNDELPGFVEQQAFFFQAAQVIKVDDDTTVWIGGVYNDGQFLPPPEPEPEPELEMIEGTFEELPPTEVPSDPLAS